MTRRDQVLVQGSEVAYRQWPVTLDGQIDDNGTVRDMTSDEVAELTGQLDEADRAADRAEIPSDLERAKANRDQHRDARLEMVDGDDQLPKWSRDITFAGTGDTVRAEQRIGHLVQEVTKLHGTVRELSAVIVRLIRAQNLDE